MFMVRLVFFFLLFVAFRGSAQERMPIVYTAITTNHQVTKGNRIDDKATDGSLPVWDTDGKPIASIFYVYYGRSGVADNSIRPLVVSFNGGPGAGLRSEDLITSNDDLRAFISNTTYTKDQPARY